MEGRPERLRDLPGIDHSGGEVFERFEEGSVPAPYFPEEKAHDALVSDPLPTRDPAVFPNPPELGMNLLQSALAEFDAEALQREVHELQSALDALLPAEGEPADDVPRPFAASNGDYIRPEALSILTERIGQLEAVVGSPAPCSPDTISLCQTIARLEERVMAVDFGGLESLAGRLSAVEAAMKNLPPEGSFPDKAEIEKRYIRLSKYDGLAEQIPGIADRLLTLQDVHTDALG
eukprot:Sspe_Gene.93468::Locus_66099_Transcript_1_1_Confidence_1.000_Length_745::g.93468::m.93468